jgi:hypothetical protein
LAIVQQDFYRGEERWPILSRGDWNPWKRTLQEGANSFLSTTASSAVRSILRRRCRHQQRRWHPGFGAVKAVDFAIALGGSLNTCSVRAGRGFAEAERAENFAGGNRIKSFAFVRRCRTAAARNTAELVTPSAVTNCRPSDFLNIRTYETIVHPRPPLPGEHAAASPFRRF